MPVTWKTELPQLIPIAAMFAAAILLWSSSSDEIPIHWGPSGQPDRFAGKAVGLLLTPLVTLGLYILLLLVALADNAPAEYRRRSSKRWARSTSRDRLRGGTHSLETSQALIYGTILLSINGFSSMSR